MSTLAPFIQQLNHQIYPLPNDPYQFFPPNTLENDQYILVPSPPLLHSHASVHAYINPPQPDGNHINETFDYHATPRDERLSLVSLFMQGQLSPWTWNSLLPIPIRIPVAIHTSSAPSRPWTELPGDVTADILRRVGAAGMLFTAQRVCSAWWRACKDPALWRVVDFSDPNQGKWARKYTAMCRHAVDLSQGQLVDLTVQYFGDDALLDYVVDRSPNLKRLKLGSCFYVSGYCAVRMAAKLGQLEELHLTLRPCIGAADIEAIGNSCTMLKSFSCNGCKNDVQLLPNEPSPSMAVFYRNLYAIAICKSMPKLEHLQLFAHWIGNEGLEIILKACPRLESLDIRQCLYLDLEGDLGKRCRQQIKHLKLPLESISDVPWPNCDGGDPFSPSNLMFEYYEYDYDDDYQDYFGRYGKKAN